MQNWEIVKKVYFEAEKQGKFIGTSLADMEITAYFLALPKSDRKKVFGFHSITEFRKRFNISQKRLQTILQDDTFWKLRENYMKQYFKHETPEILQRLIDKIKKSPPKAQDVKLYLQYVEGWVPESKMNVGVAHFKKIQEELKVILGREKTNEDRKEALKSLMEENEQSASEV